MQDGNDIPRGQVISIQSPSTSKALLIGNAAYDHLPSLLSPTKNADLLEQALLSIGIPVTKLTNLNAREMSEAVRKFAADARDTNSALIYFSGYGFQLAGRNLLVATDFDPANSVAQIEHGMDVDNLLSELSFNNLLVPIVIADIVPLPNNAHFDEGLGGPIHKSTHAIVCYAREDVSSAFHSNDPYFSFTEALAEEITQPGVSVATVIRRASGRTQAENEIKGAKVAIYDNLGEDVFLTYRELPPATPTVEPSVSPPASEKDPRVVNDLICHESRTRPCAQDER
jgi:hypothetical protein